MGCGRSKFHSHDEQEKHSKTNGIDKDKNSNNPTDAELESAKSRTRRCTPAVNTNGALQQPNFNIPTQDKAYEKFSANKPFSNKGIAPQVLRVTNSQLEFFKMLDEKIEMGGQFSSDEEESIIYYKQSTELVNS
ncbi:uncharacterized protein LOC143063857 [Mytilus galloprovincialis]|uniref:Uncharacterized protein n=1 Tax=Mytilus galloprovincialis TaxID=29158 RepID=A0A8B6GQY5_MYTGA|nr:Hypothetical predicted protein [Mytilus galloprovincialis]